MITATTASRSRSGVLLGVHAARPPTRECLLDVAQRLAIVANGWPEVRVRRGRVHRANPVINGKEHIVQYASMKYCSVR